MNRFIKLQKNTIILVLAFLMPALLMLFIAIAGNFAPFGKVSILIADMQYQFVDYIGYMKKVFFENDDLFYSFSKTFGGDMAGFSAYYLFNPFFLILLFVPNDILPIGIIIMMIIICGGCGLTFYLMQSGIWGIRFASVIFSTAYAMMGFMMAYINCIHYFFSIMLLPLVILGLFKMVRGRRTSLLYVISAALSVISCYYIGYMILIFTAAFFLFILFSNIEKFNGIKDIIRTAWIVLYTTLLAVGISAFSLCAVVLSLRGQKSSGIQLSLSRNFNILEFFSGLYEGSFHGNISDGLPIIYSSVIAVVFLILYFLNSNIKIKEKILAAALFVFMIAGFWIDALNVAWHGFAHPIGFPYRNSFLFSFLVLFFGYRGFVLVREGFKMYHAWIVVGIFAIYSVYLYLIHSSYAGIKSIIVTGVIVIVVLSIIIVMVNKNKYIVPMLAGLITIQLCELFMNGSMSVDGYYEDKEDESVMLETFSNYVDETQAIVDKIQTTDTGFYRMDKLYRRTHNDPMMFGYNGLSHFSSCETDQVKRFMGRLGFRDNENWAYYGHGSTTFADCFMGLKYLVSQFDETCKPYSSYFTYNDKYIYKNPYALPIAFTMKKNVTGLNMEASNHFELQNKIASSFTGTKFEIYRPVKVSDIVLSNVHQDGNTYIRDNIEEEAYIEYVLDITSTDFIYMYFNAPDVQKASLNIEGMDKENYFTLYDWSIRECGYFPQGTQAHVRFTLEDDELTIDDYAFYYEKAGIIDAWYKEAAQTKCTVNKITSSQLTANVNINDSSDILVFTIPYEKDWIVEVDGEKVDSIKVMDALMALELSKGEHTIEMRYIPRGLIIGTPISIIALITTFCVIFAQKKKKTQAK